jgi:hypothetical protein
MSDNKVTQWMVNQLVSPETQAQIAETYEGIPMDSIRLAWPFKTEEERELIRKWMKQQDRKRKTQVLDKAEPALM